jgi:CheY-like chemotaxis protein
MADAVLVVDDDPLVLRTVADMLEDLDWEVTTAESGSQALEEVERNALIRLLITDINMPGMDGHELAERATRLRPELQVVQLSGRERRRDGLPLIKKPFSTDELAEALKRITEGI